MRLRKEVYAVPGIVAALVVVLGGYVIAQGTGGGAPDGGNDGARGHDRFLSSAIDLSADDFHGTREAALDELIACVEASGIVEADVTAGEGLRPTRVTWLIPSDEENKERDREAGQAVLDACYDDHQRGGEAPADGGPQGYMDEEEGAELLRDALSHVEACMAATDEIPGDVPTQPFVGVPGMEEVLEEDRLTIPREEWPLYRACALEAEAATGVAPPPPLFEEDPEFDPLEGWLDRRD